MIVMGLISLIFAAFMLYQRRDIKRLFAYSSIEHMGLITFAFGMGGPLANFAGLLHMAMHSLTKSAIFFAVGHVAQAKGTQRIAGIRGLSVTHPSLAIGLAVGVFAISGLPPFGVFMSEFLILTTTFARAPWLAIFPAFGLLVAFGALLWRLQDLLFGEPTEPAHKVSASSVPLIIHLGLVLYRRHLLAADAGGLVRTRCRDAQMKRPVPLAAAALATKLKAGPTVSFACGSMSGTGSALPWAVPRASRICWRSGLMAMRPTWGLGFQHSSCGSLCQCR